ncbi:MAG: cyclic nucleotide-binding domain-containing protein [Deltaproteobacteria bacterium]|nr:cyclic nucleotide-binding domain-containing protein [Deltaproteobacteria bacterium]
MPNGKMLKQFGFDRQESRVLVWGAATLFLTGWADVSLKNVSETYFVSQVGPERLPYVFLASSALLFVSTWGMGHWAARAQRLRLLPRVLVFLAVAILPLWWLIASSDDPLNEPSQSLKTAFGMLLIASKQVQSIALLVFWAAMNDLVNGRQAKRVFAPLMAGWTLGTIFGSFASHPLAGMVGVATLVPISSGFLVLAALTTYPLRRGVTSGLQQGGLRRMLRAVRDSGAAESAVPHEAPASVRTLWGESRLFRLLLVTVMLSGMLGPMLYFQFQFVAHAATTGGEEAVNKLLNLYSVFRGWVNLGVLIAQLLFASSLYRWIGIPLSLALSPVVYLLGFAGLTVRLALPVGIGAMSATKLQDNAIFEPASRVLYNLFPDRHRSRAGSFLDGPVKRGAGALGNLVIIAALSGASQVWVGYSGMGLALIWLFASLVLWREYPRLLLAATSKHQRNLGASDWDEELLDASTVRVLGQQMLDSDPERCAAGIELIEEARPDLSIPAITGALREAPESTRALLLKALEDAIDRAVTTEYRNAGAAADVEAAIAADGALPPLDRARLVQCYGRLVPKADLERIPLFERSAEDPTPAVRLATAASLEGADLHDRLAAAVAGDDAGEHAIVRRALRVRLLCDPDHPDWEPGLALLVRMLDVEAGRREAAALLADVAARHGERVRGISDDALVHLRNPDAETRAHLLRFTGHAGCTEHINALIGHLTSVEPATAAAAREGLMAMGPQAADVLMKEAAHGRRSTRNAILPLLRELRVDHDELWEMYDRELKNVRRQIIQHHVMSDSLGFDLVVQRLDERVDEGLHTALMLLAGLRTRYSEEFEDLAESLPGTPSGRRRATLVVVLEEIADAREKDDLLPLLDEDRPRRCARAARTLGIEVPAEEEVIRQIRKSSDELSRTLVEGSLVTLGGTDLAPPEDLEDHPDVLSPTEIALQLKALPMFDGLTTRQLMDLAQVVSEVTYPPNTPIIEEGGLNESMFLLVDGEVEVRKNGDPVAKIGPNEFFGEMSLLERAPPSADVVTLEESRLLCLQRTDLFRLMEEFPTIPIIMCQTLSRRMRELLEARTPTA